ncbi:MAG: T9SS type A sorting domain-containing protein [Flavobacteriales bacterium]|nr:T9SS type A sorting domain-containing protein [Flavobacteriales bacterium]
MIRFEQIKKNPLVRFIWQVGVLLLLFCPVMQAQSLSNSSFESWSSFGSPPTDYEDPDGWTSTNGVVAFSFIPTTKITDSYSSIYAAQIRTIGIFGEYPTSILCNGDPPKDFINFSLDIIRGGTPITSTPNKLLGYYKYIPDTTASDTAYAVVILKKYNVSTGNIDTTGLGTLTFQPASNYTAFQVNINEINSAITPDSIVVAFFNKSSASDIGKLIIDSLSLSTTVGVPENPHFSTSLRISPNPFQCCTEIQTYIQGSLEGELIIYDVLGGIQARILLPPGNNVIQIDNPKLPKGVYFCSFYIQGQLVETKRMVRVR